MPGNSRGGRFKPIRMHCGRTIVAAGGLTLFSCLGLARFAYGMLLPSMGKALHLGASTCCSG